MVPDIAFTQKYNLSLMGFPFQTVIRKQFHDLNVRQANKNNLFSIQSSDVVHINQLLMRLMLEIDLSDATTYYVEKWGKIRLNQLLLSANFIIQVQEIFS